MKKLLFFATGMFLLAACDGGPNPCMMSEAYVKHELNFPNEAEMSFLDCNSEKLSNGNYRVLRKVTGKNAFGMSETFIYEIVMKYNGGESVDQNNWQLESIRSEKTR